MWQFLRSTFPLLQVFLLQVCVWHTEPKSPEKSGNNVELSLDIVVVVVGDNTRIHLGHGAGRG